MQQFIYTDVRFYICSFRNFAFLYLRCHLIIRISSGALLFAGSILTGCASTEKSSKSRKNNGSADHEITVAINSETGSLDPAGSIALTYLAYSVSALDELLTFDENGEIEYRAALPLFFLLFDDFSVLAHPVRILPANNTAAKKQEKQRQCRS